MRALLLAALLVLAPAASATEAESPSLQAILKQQIALREDLARGPVDLTPRQLAAVRKAQAEFFRLVEGKMTLDQLAIDDRIRVENALEKINAQIVGTHAAQENQEVCWSEQRLGSRTKNTRCGTQKEIDQVREGARTYMEKPKICMPPGCGA